MIKTNFIKYLEVIFIIPKFCLTHTTENNFSVKMQISYLNLTKIFSMKKMWEVICSHDSRNSWS